jgi:arabinofuranosyltransferase
MTSSIQMTEAIEHVREAAASPAVSLARTIIRHAMLLMGLFVLLSALYWVAVYAVAGKPGFPLDDSFIHLQYARSIWEGHSFEYNYLTNPGVRSSGTSAPLWTIMLTGAYALTRNWLCASYALGVAWTALGVGLAYWLVLRWTSRAAWAFFGAAMLVVTHPTIISAYEGMEPAAYVAVFLLGLVFYDFSRQTAPSPSHCHIATLSHNHLLWRLAASVVFAVGVWLRPEFLVMPVLIAGERLLTLRREGSGWRGRWSAEMSLQAAVWVISVVPYLAFNKWLAGTLLPNTYTIKAISRNFSPDMQFQAGLPAAWLHWDWIAALRCVTIWQVFMAISVVVCLLLNNAVLAWKLPRGLKEAWRGRLGPAGCLAGTCLLGFPLARALVDPVSLFFFQYQRYFAHVTALMIVLAVAVLATGAIGPSRRLVGWAVLAGLLGPFAVDYQAVKAIDNINDMQVTIGRWLRDNTPPGSVVAANDVGAIAFYSQRRVMDTVGLTEPSLGRFYLVGGTLEQYLRQERPQYACLFPNWHDKIAKRSDLFELLFKVDLNKGGLDRNVICGGPSMWVLRTCWNKDAKGR